MNTITEKIATEIESGYRLTYAEFKQINEESIEKYMNLVANKLIGLKKEDMVHLSSVQEKSYKKLRDDYFKNIIAFGSLKQNEFLSLTDVDKRIFAKSLARMNKRVPEYLLINDTNRYWYSLWYSEKNRAQINHRLQTYRASLSKEEKQKKRECVSESNKKYKETEKGRKRTLEYRRNYYRQKQLLSGKEIRQYTKNRMQFYTPNKSIHNRIRAFLDLFQF